MEDQAAFSEESWHLPCSDWAVLQTTPLPVAVLMTSFEPGGTERQMIELVRRLDPARWTVHVACFRARGAWLGRVAAAAASIAEFPVSTFKKPGALNQMWAFARWCRARRIAVAHTADLYANVFGLPGAALAGVPVRVANRREINPDKTLPHLALQRAAYACAHKIVANSRAASDRLRAERIPARKIAVIANGLDPDAFTQYRPPSQARRVIVVANLRREKGHDVLIEAAPEILRRFPDARFEIVGEGPMKPRLLALARERGVLHAFTFAGHREDVAARLAEADLFVLPSRSEAFPNAVLEAAAAGRAIVATRVGGVGELVDHDRSGLLVEPDDPQALGEHVCRLLGDPALAARLGVAARTRAARYSFDRMVAAFERLYRSELARRGMAAAADPELATS
jgi:glycosyltransferase involved in cell wall biosynthesis